MQIESLRDVLHWAREYHQHVHECAQHCGDSGKSERAKLLLRYLADHEAQLVATLGAFEETANVNALYTWCAGYLQRHPIAPHENCSKPLADLSTDEIFLNVMHQHGQIMDLYEHLLGRLPVGHAADLLKGLKELEENENMQMAKHVQQLEDM